MLRYSLVLVVTLGVAGTAGAATWADALFDELSKDFGSVPRGPTLKHDFKVKNNTKQTVTISSLRVSCGCVAAAAKTNTLQPGESTTVEVTMDTTRFTGPKTVTIFVQFSEPRFEEVRLWVQANGRNDFALSPDALRFGQVKRGATPTVSTTMTFYGHPKAKVTQVKGESNYVKPAFKEAKRTETEVTYTISVKLIDTTPVGRWFTDVWVKTDVPGLAQVRVPLTVDVESPLTVSPAVVALGAVKAKVESERRVIIRGVAPFKITAVKGVADDMVVKKSAESRQIHVLTVKVKPGKPGAIDRTIRVVTDLKKDNEIDFKVSATVTAD
jgi:hypothetical protein